MNIEKYLILNKYLLSLFGISEFRDLQEKLRDTQVDIDRDGKTYFIDAILSLGKLQRDKLPEDALLIYDENVQSYAKKISYRREPISLKYFQYLAVLFTEIILDNLKNRKIEFLYELNEFFGVYKRNEEIKSLDEFTENDLRKIAFWMATGSGKTLIMHVNYYQFMKYRLFSPDNIILITPNEGLSKQHFEELEKSGIPCRLYGGNMNNLQAITGKQEILVIEMTKIVEEKKGGGVTLPVNAFEGKSLVFVDEGHKGKRSEDQKWAKLRNKLAENGFVFEYSATFGQILSESNKETLEEYAKAIAFDYSYKYFYLDGYGKDFSVLNVEQAKVSEQEFQETMFAANLLSFYEQVIIYEENKNLSREYNLEKPLWIFVGTTVTGKEEESDVVQIVDFIRRTVKDEGWIIKKTNDILTGKTELKNDDAKDVFDDKFGYLKDNGFDIDDLYKKVFSGKGSFGIYDLKNADGELGLKIGENDYFGVINIGNVSKFKKELEKIGINVNQDAVSGSLFDTIKRDNSSINILIGSKKFIEGWDTWRVSSMGLLNIGKGQGPQIIQLFGRGIRLKGKGLSLKRSDEKTPVQSLEKLNIYGIKADYLSRFLEAISKEETEFETIEIPVNPLHEEKWGTLYTLSKNENKKFEEEAILKLSIEETLSLTIDLQPKVSTYFSKERKEEGVKIEHVKANVMPSRIPDDIVDLLNWNKIYQEIYEWKVTKGYWNIVISHDVIRGLLLSDRYRIIVLPEMLEVKKINDIDRIEEIAIMVIKRYIDAFYRRYARRFETENMTYATAGEQLPLFVFEKPGGQHSYTVQINKREKELIKEIKELAKNLDKLLQDDTKILPRVYFERHLYVPILLQSKRIDKISPVGLVESEKEFIIGLRRYLLSNKAKFSDVEIFLLRNYPKTGVGFFNLSGFYPDFIMWIKSESKQTIAFIDPKGLEHTKGLDDEKIKLRDDIKILEQKFSNDNISLESFIISKTSYNTLKEGRTDPPSKDDYFNHHVLFLDDVDWSYYLFKEML